MDDLQHLGAITRLYIDPRIPEQKPQNKSEACWRCDVGKFAETPLEWDGVAAS
jgi:hypothetical protein